MKKESMSFEESLKKLEEIVRGLEEGKFDLDESLKKYEQGVTLYKECRTTLGHAEKKIKILTDQLNEDNLEV